MRQNTVIEKIKIGIKKDEINSLIHFLLALFIVLWLNGGVMMYVTPYIPAAFKILVFFIWFLIACFKKGYINEFLNKGWPLIAFLLILLSAYILNPNNYLFLQLTNVTYMICIFSIFLFYFKDYLFKFQKILVFVLSIDFLYIGINTAIKLQQNPFISRCLGTDIETRELLLGPGIFPAVGSYVYFYSMVILVLMLFFIILKTSENRWLYAFICLLLTLLIIKAQYTISILLLFTFLFLILLIHYSHKYKKKFVIIAIGSVCVLLLFMPDIMMVLSKWEVVPGEVAIRSKEMAYTLSFNSQEGTDLGVRGALYTKSFETFLSNPFLGSLEADGMGGHSSWMDMLSMFGLLALFLFSFFIKNYLYIKSKFSSKWKPFVGIYWLYYAMLGLINTTLFAGFSIILFIYIPFFLSVFDKKKIIQIKMNKNTELNGTNWESI